MSMLFRKWEVRLLVAVAVAAAGCGDTDPEAAVEQMDWRLVSAPQGEDIRIIVPIPSDATCGSFDHVEVSESPESVSVRAFVRQKAEVGGTCTDDLGFEEVDVQLDEELGERSLTGCDAPPDGSLFFNEPVSAEGCAAAIRRSP